MRCKLLATAIMELLLNLIWLGLAIGALAAFVEGRRRSARTAEAPFGLSLLALVCVLVLLFPVISASDDLHPAQAVVEDASKRLQLAIAPLNVLRTSAPPMLPAMLALCLMFIMPVLRPFRAAAVKACVLDGTIVLPVGRAPPSLSI
jgi:hypothetical protein